MKILLSLSLIVAGALVPAWAVGPEEDSYREACGVLSEARQAWQKRDSDLAWQRYLEAKKLFVAIQKDYPGWNAGTVAAHLAVCGAGSEKTAPSAIRELDQSILELKRFSADLDKLKTQKLIALQQADWEHNFVYDRITRLMDNYVAQRTVAAAAGEEPVGPAAGEEELAAALEEVGWVKGEVAVGLGSDNDELIAEVEAEIGAALGDSFTDSDELYDDIYDRIGKLIGDYASQWIVGEEIESLEPGSEEEELAAALEESGFAEGEVAVGLDSDGDDLTDEVEVEIGTSPIDSDTDGDGFYDGDEVEAGYDPLDDSSHPDVDEVPDYDEDNINWEEQEGYTEDGEPLEEDEFESFE